MQKLIKTLRSVVLRDESLGVPLRESSSEIGMRSVVDPDTEAIVRVLMSERACAVDLQAFMQLPLDPDAQLRPKPFVLRRDGVPCSREQCSYGYVAAPLLADDAAQRQVAYRQSEHQGRLLRYFVTLAFRRAVMVDCTDLLYLDERALRDNESRAVAYLRALRDAGADVLWIRGTSASRIAVIFTESVGSAIEVVDEAPHALVGDSWQRMTPPADPPADEPPPGGREPHSQLVLRVSFASRFLLRLGSRLRRHRMLLVWELSIGMLCALVAPDLTRLFSSLIGFSITLPLWSVLVASVLGGWLIALVLSKRAGPYVRLVLELLTVIRGLPSLEDRLRQDRDFFRRAATEMLGSSYADGLSGAGSAESEEEDDDDDDASNMSVS
jgi:hypothetical protein